MRNIISRFVTGFRVHQPIGKVVDFVICGTQKGGTSALDSYLREHPEICMADCKEVHYFDDESQFANGNPDYSVYHSHFTPKSNHKILGEATPIYMYWYLAPKRIFEYNPEMKLILLLRNPVERAYSHWNMEYSRKTESLNFLDAITNEKKRCKKVLPLQHRIYSYVDRGHYLTQLRRIWTYFPKNKVLVLRSEDLKLMPEKTLNQICDFLTINRFNSVGHKNVHSRTYESPMTDQERTYLNSIFAPEIKELERELNWDCSNWLDR